MERYFQERASFDTHCTVNLPPFPILKKSQFFKKTQRFQKIPNFCTNLKNFTISVAFYDKFATILWWKVFKFTIFCILLGQLANKRTKKMFALCVLGRWFSIHIKDMAENKNKSTWYYRKIFSFKLRLKCIFVKKKAFDQICPFMHLFYLFYIIFPKKYKRTETSSEKVFSTNLSISANLQNFSNFYENWIFFTKL